LVTPTVRLFPIQRDADTWAVRRENDRTQEVRVLLFRRSCMVENLRENGVNEGIDIDLRLKL
jgi:hypothetical protein